MIYLYSVVCFVILLLSFKYFAPKVNLIDKPNFRKQHKGNIPLVGGLIIYINILTTLIRQWLPDTLYLTSFMMVKNIVSKTCSLGVATFVEFMVTYCTQLVQGILTRALMPIAKRYQLAFSNTVSSKA